MLTKLRILVILITILITPLFFFLLFQYISKAAPIKANIIIDSKRIVGPFPNRWKALAQGGEELGTRMLENVVPQVAGLYPRYIRLDHIYDGYDVVQRNDSGNLIVDFTQLDETVCDIYHAGAKPFFSLGYMPKALATDDTMISTPSNWDEWSLVVQKTVEHYSGKSTRLCGQITGPWLTDIYYEVWNEPDLETFGKWSLYGGKKDYKALYAYSVKGAENAKDVNRYLIGGPVTTALYENWIERFLDYINENDLRLDFISWHHYSKNANDYIDDMKKLDTWLDGPAYVKYKSRPRIISEWGFDSDSNEATHTDIGAAHTVASIRNFIDTNIEAAFLFEIKDGLTPRWGILSHEGVPTRRYDALKLMNELQGYRISMTGEGTFVTGLASRKQDTIRVILVNYDLAGSNYEQVPVSFTRLEQVPYTITVKYLDNTIPSVYTGLVPENGVLKRDIILSANKIVYLELKPE